MTLVTQITPFTCGLACIESICADFNISKKQEDLLREFKNELICDAPKIEVFGSTSPLIISHILKALGFNIHPWKDHRPEILKEQFEPTDLSEESIIIFANFNLSGHHIVRYAGFKEDETIFIMNPTFSGAKIEECSISNLISWNYSFIKVTA